MTYNRFAPGEPASRSNVCVVITPQGQWKVAPCTTAMPTICELPQGAALVAALDALVPELPKLGWLVAMVSCVLLCALLVVAPLGCGRDKKQQVNVGAEANPLLVKW